MITKDNFKSLLSALEFTSLSGKGKGIYIKQIGAFELRVDFNTETLIYPESDGMKINERQTCNMKANENFVVFECIHHLLSKGYNPAHIELEPKWQLGRGASGGRADILVKDNDENAYLIIECKTWGEEFNKEWNNMLLYGGQLFSYAQQIRSTQFICLYSSEFEDGHAVYTNHIIALRDNDEYLKSLKEPFSFAKATDVQSLYKAWFTTYNHEFELQGIFEEGVSAYEIGKKAHTAANLLEVTHEDIQKKYHQFATILRQHNVSGRENAFDKLVNLFLAKIVDEMQNPEGLRFYWKGVAFDDYFSLLDRILRLYRDGMQKFLNEEVTYIDDSDIKNSFNLFKNDPDATRDTIIKYFRQLKFYTNNDFTFLDVHNEHLFMQNSAILLEIVKMIQDIRLKTEEQNQFLGDLFEGFLDQGIKQSEGQFFTPMPIVKFLVSSLPLQQMIESSPEPLTVMDYACGAGHFLNEYATQIRSFLKEEQLSSYYEQIVGIEKEYRLSKVAKVSAFMYGQDEIRIVYADALAQNDSIKNGKYNVLISNPPYSVKGFLEMLSDEERASFDTTDLIDKKSIHSNNSIEAFFVERAKQLLAPGGVAAIILPSSILSNGGAVYTKAREIILQYFDIVAIAEFGSGTFGKTGTNTVTLFLRRKAENPSISEHYKNRVSAWFNGDFMKDDVFGDFDLLEAYCLYFGYELYDYKTFLQNNPNQALLNTDTFKAYRTVFDKTSEIRNLKTKQFFKKLSEAYKLTELNRRFIEYVRSIEQEKLYYFILAYTNPQDVVVVKSPAGTEIKKYLGYEWSSAKGNEGIKYIGVAQVDENGAPITGRKGINGINTPLFNPIDLTDTSKINSIIRANFNGVAVGESEFVSRLRLIDMVDLNGTDIKKTISLTAARTSVIKSKYRLEKLLKFCSVINGGTPSTSRPDFWNGDIPWLSVADFSNTNRYVSSAEKSITQAGYENSSTNILQPMDIIISARGTVGAMAQLTIPMAFNQSCYGLHPNDNIESGYLFYALKSIVQQLQEQATGSKFKAFTSELFKTISIPYPPHEVQREIVAACEAVDGKVPVYSANVFRPFGYIDKLLITEFHVPSVLWGIDGDWQVNYIPENEPFYPTDHCGVLRVKNEEKIHPRYLAWALNKAGTSRGFTRSLRASIDRIKKLRIDLPDPKSQKKVVDEVFKLEQQIITAEQALYELESKRQGILESYIN